MAFPDIKFAGTLRPTQKEVAEVVREQFDAGNKEYYIVAPPGSGKTITGLYLWAEFFKCPALVLSPNTAIQSQWLSRLDLFTEDDDVVHQRHLSSDPKNPSVLNSFTYQSITLPSQNKSDFESLAISDWVSKLMEKNLARDPDEAMIWINDLREHNPDYFKQRFGAHVKKVRDAHATQSGGIDTLHKSAVENLQYLKDMEVNLVILDECHHLLGHWGRIMHGIRDFFGDPYILGLTATPPHSGDYDTVSWEQYHKFIGEIDFEVPIPAVVKEGYLAPYQDLCYFTRPMDDELTFVSNMNDRLLELLETVSQGDAETGRMSLPDFIYKTLEERMLLGGPAENWGDYADRLPRFSVAARVYLYHVGRAFPLHVPALSEDQHMEYGDTLKYVTPCLDRYVRTYLMVDENPRLHDLAGELKTQLRMLGMQITETGSQACASPISRVLAYSKAKVKALQPILKAEMADLGDRIRAVVVCDYEKTSAVSEDISHLLSNEAGGAVAAFKQILTDEETDRLDPVLVTGSSVLVDDDLKEVFDDAAKHWLERSRFKVDWKWRSVDGFHVMQGQGADWSPRLYVEMITALFQQGITKCLVGTRGLLGEGWDANKINVLVDLTCVTTHTSVNQLRGRSMRLDPDEPEKLANNWDVVCLAPEYVKGLDDYIRFTKKHTQIFGITDDGVIEKGVGHVHAALTELKPEGVESSAGLLNDDMISRIPKRGEARELWGIGKPYQREPQTSVEMDPGLLGPELKGKGFPPFSYAETPWDEATFTFAVSCAVLKSLVESEILTSIVLEDVEEYVHVGARDGGYVRVFMKETDEESSRIFSEAVAEIFAPIRDPRYLIERKVAIGDISRKTKRTFVAEYMEEFMAAQLDYEVLEKNLETKLVMVHAVPTELARNRDRADIFLKHWHELVSPGKMYFMQRDEGREFLQQARNEGLVPLKKVHRKDIFM
ncbi:MAG: DEAD/DEAH box helicase family protein [Planctomycetota bacterium]|nr:DEAD/DEAH box helicase family protein [Planctomycetota bacterium]